jgi:hypothetical protein
MNTMKFNPYPVLLATGALMLAAAVFAQNADTPSTDEAKHPERSRVGKPSAETSPAGHSQNG